MKFGYQIREGVDLSEPLVYLWEIKAPGDGQVICHYVGKARDAGRPLSQYRRNVENLQADREYRKGNRDGFRSVHRCLSRAVDGAKTILLTFLENVQPGESAFQAEKRWQKFYANRNPKCPDCTRAVDSAGIDG